MCIRPARTPKWDLPTRSIARKDSTENMDFQSANLFNVRINTLSGNLLPLTPDGSQFPIKWKVYSGLLWLIQVVSLITLILGFALAPWEKALLDNTVTFVVHLEVFFVVTRLHLHRRLIGRLIRKLNDILSVEDETMRSIVTTTLKSMDAPLKFYWIIGGLSVLVWSCLPFVLVFKKTSFGYEDYRVAMVLSKQPFSTDVFLLGNVIATFGSVYIFSKKAGMDVYMIHMVLLLTAQYRYIAARLSTIFRNANLQHEPNGSHQKQRSGIDQRTKREMRELCRHYHAVISLSSMLKKLLSSSFNMIYVNSVFRFCFIGIMLSAVASMVFLEGFVIASFACGSIVQFYMLCSCVQQLLDASKETTNEAFYEKWYEFAPSLKRTFMLMILSNSLDCKLSMCDKFSLSLPSFMTILNQSYSVALLFIRMK